MTHSLQHRPGDGLGGRTPSPVPDRNTDEVRNFSVGTPTYRAAGTPWLTAALEVRGISSEQAPRALEAVKAILTQTNAERDYVRWGTGPLRGRIVARWRPRREDNAVSYATQIARSFLAASQREFSPSSSFIMRRFKIDMVWPATDLYVYPETDFTTITRETLPSEVMDERGRPVSAEDAARRQSGGLSQEAQTALVVSGVAVGVLAIGGLGFYLVSRRSSVKSNKRKRSSR